MANKMTRSLYDDSIVINFYPDSHRYQMEGKKDYLISVTGITGTLDKSRALIPWATGLASAFLIEKLEAGEPITHECVIEACNQHAVKKEEAASIGSHVHDYAQSFAQARIDGNPLPEIPEGLPEAALAGINAFLDWVDAHKVQFEACERLLYSKTHGYVGLTDIIAVVDGKRYIGDYKTSKGLYDEHFFQLSGYWGAYEEETGEELAGGMLMHFDKETGSFAVREINRDEHNANFAAFLGLFAAKKRLKELQAEWYKNNK